METALQYGANRKGDWIETFTGIHFYPLDPRPEEVRIEDITHALSQICRFTGHTRYFYSVAQHCLNCADLAGKLGLTPRHQLLALLHDASEAYLCDLPRPVKGFIEGYKMLEWKLQQTIFDAFNVENTLLDLEAIKYLDRVMLVTEGKVLMPCRGWRLEEDERPTPLVEVAERSIIDVRMEYLERFENLRGAMQNGK